MGQSVLRLRKPGTMRQMIAQRKQAWPVWDVAALWLISLLGQEKRKRLWRSPAVRTQPDNLAPVNWRSRKRLPNGLSGIQENHQLSPLSTCLANDLTKKPTREKGGAASL